MKIVRTLKLKVASSLNHLIGELKWKSVKKIRGFVHLTTVNTLISYAPRDVGHVMRNMSIAHLLFYAIPVRRIESNF